MLNFASPAVVADPGPLHAQLHQGGPVHRFDPMNAWLVVRHKDVHDLLHRIPEPPGSPPTGAGALSSGGLRYRKGIDFFPAEERREKAPRAEEFAETLGRMMLFHDPPEHTRLRKHLMPPFSRAALARYRAGLEREVHRLVDTFPTDKGFDLVAAFAYQLPAGVICELLAIPPDRRTTQIDRSDDLAHFFFANPPTMQQLSRASESTCAMTEWFRQLHAERQGGTGDDLVTLLARYIHASDEPISVDEVAAQCALLLAAGQETTRNLLGMSCRTLLQNPDALHALAADPALIPGAVEELLRFESPVQLVAREVTEPVTVGGQTIPAGRVVFLMLGSANRDPAVFPDPDRFDIHRANARQHLAFGSGRHFCIGAELARLEAAVALEVLVPVLLKLQLAGEPEWAPNLALRGIKKLPVAWATSPARGHA